MTSDKRNSFKEFQVASEQHPPTNWREERLVCVADIRFSNVDKKSLAGEIPVRLCNYLNVYTNEYITSSLDFMEATVSPAEIARFTVEKGDVIATKDSETPNDIGVTSVVVEDIPDLICGYHLAQIKPHKDQVDSIFLAKQMGMDRIVRYFGRCANGSTRYGLATKSFEDMKVWLPSLPIQRKIARILTTIDNQIEKTEALIAKYEAIKQGMMHDLFTRGVDKNGRLRPPQSQAPHHYKQSPLGWIPKEWETRRLEELLAAVEYPMRSGPFGSSLRKSELVEDGIPFLGIDNVFCESFSRHYTRFVSDRKFEELRQYAVREKDVMITIMGTVGRSCIVPSGVGRALSSKHIWVMTFDQSKYLPELICWQLNYAPWVLAAFDRHSQGAVMAAISSRTLRKLTLPVPRFEEQKTISLIYGALSRSIEDMGAELRKNILLKQGLMQDLLTGKVPVIADDPDSPDHAEEEADDQLAASVS